MITPRPASAGSRMPLALQLLLPSAASAVWCVLGGMGIVTLHVVSVTIHRGTLFPELFDGQWAVAYTNGIVGPVSAFFGSHTLNVGLSALLWGALGALIYELVSTALRGFAEWREVEHDVRITVEDGVIRHPLRRSFIARILWRMLVLVVAVAIAVAVRPTLQAMLARSEQLALAGAPALANALTVGLLVAGWTLVFHAGVVLMRLYVLRARLWH